MSNKATSLFIGRVKGQWQDGHQEKGQRQDGMGVGSVPAAVELSHADALEVTVIPLLEYSGQLWNPRTAKGTQAIEAFQRTFTNKITEVQHLNYWERLHKHKLYCLQRRRERYIITHIWKITQHMVPNIFFTMDYKIKTRNHPRRTTYPVWPHRQGSPRMLKVARLNPGCGWDAPIFTMHEVLGGYCPWGWGCDQSIGSTVSDAIVRSWLWSTATRGSTLGYFSRLLQVVDNWPHILWY